MNSHQEATFIQELKKQQEALRRQTRTGATISPYPMASSENPLFPKANALLDALRGKAEREGLDLVTYLDNNNLPPRAVFGFMPAVSKFDTEDFFPAKTLSRLAQALEDSFAVAGQTTRPVFYFNVTINDGSDVVMGTPDIELIQRFMQYCYRDDVDVVAITDPTQNTGVSLNMYSFLQFAQTHADTGWGAARFEVTPGPMGDEGTLAYLGTRLAPHPRGGL